MKKIIKVNDDFEILHSHRNFQRETEFVVWDKKRDMGHVTSGRIRKSNCMFNWDNPLTKEEIGWLISNF